MSPVPSTQPPTSKKKQALMPSAPLRRRLRAHGHGLSPLVRIGKEGITAGLIRQLAHILFDHELCKVKLEAECPIDRFVAAERIASQPGMSIVQILGRTILVYKRHPQNPRFEGSRAQPEGATAPFPPQIPLRMKARRRPSPA
jgi:RNA-binding protein